MNGLEFEFDRFREMALGEMDAADIEGARKIFMCGALAQSQRILDFIYSDLSTDRKLALLRRIARECEQFQQMILKTGKEKSE